MVYDVDLRRAERERVLTLLYQAEIRATSPIQILDNLDVSESEFVIERIRGIADNLSGIDDLINNASKGWPVERMPLIDRCLLRFGAYETAYLVDFPRGVAISEAVELAKQFSTSESGRFINGVLSGIVNALPSTPQKRRWQPSSRVSG